MPTRLHALALRREERQPPQQAQRGVISASAHGRSSPVGLVLQVLDTVESVPLAGTGVSLTERLAHAEYDALRRIVRSAVGVNVNVGVNVDVLSKGLHVDVLSRGVNVNVLSPGATS